MFQIRAIYTGQVEVKTSLERVRAFFGEARNFVELMPGVESITAEEDGVRRWVIRANLPFLSSMHVAFRVQQTGDDLKRIEWSPTENEKKNLLRYAATFEGRDAKTSIRLEQQVELRRQHARELHPLAGMIGEERISREMQKRVAEMMRAFLERARTRLEK